MARGSKRLAGDRRGRVGRDDIVLPPPAGPRGTGDLGDSWGPKACCRGRLCGGERLALARPGRRFTPDGAGA